jgi:hypothetical protein
MGRRGSRLMQAERECATAAGGKRGQLRELLESQALWQM